jgi:hypothetical protein
MKLPFLSQRNDPGGRSLRPYKCPNVAMGEFALEWRGYQVLGSELPSGVIICIAARMLLLDNSEDKNNV